MRPSAIEISVSQAKVESTGICCTNKRYDRSIGSIVATRCHNQGVPGERSRATRNVSATPLNMSDNINDRGSIGHLFVIDSRQRSRALVICCTDERHDRR